MEAGVRLELHLRAATLSGIGGGYGFSMVTDRPVVRRLSGETPEPYIPGSTIKGWLRRGLWLLEEVMGLEGCGRESAEDRVSRERVKERLERGCPSDILLGSRGYLEKPPVIVNEAKPVPGAVRVERFFHNALSKQTMNVRLRALFADEHYVIGSVFKTVIEIRPFSLIPWLKDCSEAPLHLRSACIRVRSEWGYGREPDPPVLAVAMLLAGISLARTMGLGLRGGIFDARVVELVPRAYLEDSLVQRYYRELTRWRWEL